ncbi:FadR/GntR family transcriptional regulator [Actinomadura vinacea]
MDIVVGDAATRLLKTSESVARDIVHDMVEQGLRTGDRMPAEPAMLECYGVSRQSLREGLRLLEVQGLISIRPGPGGGPVVGSIDPGNLGKTATLYYHLAGATYSELFDSWVLMESMLAELAARNSDRATARKALEPFLDAAETDSPEFFKHHSYFHSVLGTLAGNRVLELTFRTAGLIVSHHILAGAADPRDIRQTFDADHALVAKAIMGGHPRKAHNQMAEHIRNVAAYYEAYQSMNSLIEWR